MRNPLLLLLFFWTFLPASDAQISSKKKMDHTIYDNWNQLHDWHISNNGNWVVYEFGPESKNSQLNIYNTATRQTTSFERGYNAAISFDNKFLIFSLQPDVDTLKAMKRRKETDAKLPKDTLVIYNLNSRNVEMIPEVESKIVPEKWGDWIAYKKKAFKKKEEVKTDTLAQDSTATLPPKVAAYQLYIRQLSTGFVDSIPEPNQFVFAKEGPFLTILSDGVEDVFKKGIYRYDCINKKRQSIFNHKGDFKKLQTDNRGNQISFVADIDTNYNQIKPFNLFYWKNGMKEVTRLAHQKSKFIPNNWMVSEHRNLVFSDDGSKLFFGLSPEPILQDTLLLPEEIVQVEVWSHTDQKIYPEQNINLNNEKQKSYLAVYHTKNNKIVVIADPTCPDVSFDPSKNANKIPASNSDLYRKNVSWEGYPIAKDLYVVDLKTGDRELIRKKLRANQKISPAGKYINWFDNQDSNWYCYNISKKRVAKVADGTKYQWANELNDRPMQPWSYGQAGWTENDKHLLIYDRYDIWQIDPDGKNSPKQLTKGRDTKTRYRIIDLDDDLHFIDAKKEILLQTFNEVDKSAGYATLNLRSKKIKVLLNEDFRFTRNVDKAKNSSLVVFTKESFEKFPDLQLTNLEFKNIEQISDINPQQEKYNWGTIEIVKWKNEEGKEVEGLLVKPEGFDANKKYPMIVNFYERNSHNLHAHRAPYPHRSTINYSFYANQGYLIFNPDVFYKVGYPGDSGLKAVQSGVKHLKTLGFVDENRIGLQGHSWGGYQVAHIITKTNEFACAESGAPVVNMTSAYGGVRWRSGLSRMFQYEQTQSRIGSTLWENQKLYLENSPLFNLDKVETPVLILHNDKDGAVPWYQGIEFFLAMRRLDKTAWMLNYNNEPHWPLKRQNRIDFNRRMLQFFNHYLKDDPMPSWMIKGVPAIEKGIRQGID